jgi:hypothetical protein
MDNKLTSTSTLCNLISPVTNTEPDIVTVSY